MGVTVLFYKLLQFKADLAAILKRYCCHGNVTYKFILTTIRLLYTVSEHAVKAWYTFCFAVISKNDGL